MTATSTCVPSRSPWATSTTAADQREQRRLDGDERPEDREVAEGPADRGQAGHLGARRRGDVLEHRPTGLGPGDVDEVGEGLVEHDDQRDEQPERGPSADATRVVERPPVGTQAEGGGDRRLGRVVADAVEVDARGREPLPPPGDLAVAAVEEDLQLHGDDAEDRPPEPAERQRQRAGDADEDHQPGHAVGRDAGGEHQPGRVDRQVPDVEGAGPVLGVVARDVLRRLGHRAQRSQGRPVVRRVVGRARSCRARSCGSCCPAPRSTSASRAPTRRGRRR